MQPEAGTVADIRRHFERKGFAEPVPPRAVHEVSRAPYSAGWPEGWQDRTYRLALEASEKGATEEEITVIRGWMMDPQLQLLWSGGAPADDRMTELDGIEIGARAWLRARGRMVRKG